MDNVINVCKLCGRKNVKIFYQGKIRKGDAEFLENAAIYQCEDCKLIQHNYQKNAAQFYESSEYRDSVDTGSNPEDFYAMYDSMQNRYIEWTGVERFRNKIVADIGCAGGAFLDLAHGLAKETIAIEPSEIFRKELRKKHNAVYPYITNAIKDYQGKVDVVTSWNAIEHVEEIRDFCHNLYDLTANGGVCIVGTPTSGGVYHDILGKVWDEFRYTVQHPLVFNRESLDFAMRNAGFNHVEVKYVQLYSLSNLIAWCVHKKSRARVNSEWLTDTLEKVFEAEMGKIDKGDFIISYAYKD